MMIVWLCSQDTRLSLIATDHNYRQNFTAADDTRSTQMGTIRTIIEMIVCPLTWTDTPFLLHLVKMFVWIWPFVFFLSFQTNETKDTVCQRCLYKAVIFLPVTNVFVKLLQQIRLC